MALKPPQVRELRKMVFTLAHRLKELEGTVMDFRSHHTKAIEFPGDVGASGGWVISVLEKTNKLSNSYIEIFGPK